MRTPLQRPAAESADAESLPAAEAPAPPLLRKRGLSVAGASSSHGTARRGEPLLEALPCSSGRGEPSLETLLCCSLLRRDAIGSRWRAARPASRDGVARIAAALLQLAASAARLASSLGASAAAALLLDPSAARVPTAAAPLLAASATRRA